MQLAEGEAAPKLYGLAYWDWERRVSVCYPIPFNLLIRWVRDCWFWLRAGGFSSYREKTETAMFKRGYEVGYKTGQRVGIAEAVAKLPEIYREAIRVSIDESL